MRANRHFEREPDRKRPPWVLPACFGMLLAGTWIGMETFSRLKRVAPEREPGGRFARGGGVSSPRPATGESAAQASDFELLLGLLKEAEAEPAARRFMEEFKRERALNGLWEDFLEDQHSPEPKQTLESFARVLKDRPEFRRLVARSAGDPGFRQVVILLSQAPRIRPLAQEALARIHARRRSKALPDQAASAAPAGPPEAGPGAARP